MLHGFFTAVFVIVCFLLILLILIQKGKGGMGLGSLGGGSQMLFGGSGGQDLFQKITWGLSAFFLFGSLLLSLMKSPHTKLSHHAYPRPTQQQQVPPQ